MATASHPEILRRCGDLEWVRNTRREADGFRRRLFAEFPGRAVAPDFLAVDFDFVIVIHAPYFIPAFFVFKSLMRLDSATM